MRALIARLFNRHETHKATLTELYGYRIDLQFKSDKRKGKRNSGLFYVDNELSVNLKSIEFFSQA